MLNFLVRIMLLYHYVQMRQIMIGTLDIFNMIYSHNEELIRNNVMKTLHTASVTALVLTMSSSVSSEIYPSSHTSFPDNTSSFERVYTNQKTKTTLLQNTADKTFMGEHMGNLYRSLRKMQSASLDGDNEATLKYEKDAVNAFNKAYFSDNKKASSIYLNGAEGIQFIDSNGVIIEGKPTMVSDYNRLEFSVTQTTLDKNTKDDYATTKDGTAIRASDGVILHKGKFRVDSNINSRHEWRKPSY